MSTDICLLCLPRLSSVSVALGCLSSESSSSSSSSSIASKNWDREMHAFDPSSLTMIVLVVSICDTARSRSSLVYPGPASAAAAERQRERERERKRAGVSKRRGHGHLALSSLLFLLCFFRPRQPMMPADFRSVTKFASSLHPPPLSPPPVHAFPTASVATGTASRRGLSRRSLGLPSERFYSGAFLHPSPSQPPGAQNGTQRCFIFCACLAIIPPQVQ